MADLKDPKRLSLGKLPRSSHDCVFQRSPTRSSSFSQLFSPRKDGLASPRSDDEPSFEFRTPRGSPRTGILKIRKIGSNIGQGASGAVVYKGKIGNGMYCIKEMKYDDSTSEDVQQLFKEIDMLRKLPLNSNVVEYAGYQIIPGKIQVIMSLYCGSLYDIIQRKKKQRHKPGFTIKEIIHIISDLFHGLGVLQIRQLMHRDLKSCNILYDGEWKNIEECTFVIADLGESKIVHKNQKVGTVAGTPGWMAPEVLDSGIQFYTTAADVYSAGMVLYELITLEFPMHEHKFAGNATVAGKVPKMSMHQSHKYACLLPLYEACTHREVVKRANVQDAIRMISVLKEEHTK
jgi:serine/threonine protein kinase